MSKEADKQTHAIEQAGGDAVNEAFVMASAAEMLDIPVETLLEGVFTPFYKDASFKSAVGLKRMAAVCILLYSEKSKEEREGDE